ncbi:hypothetical protein [Streptomyces ipomoeae]|uniref:hypothetical protein n=1 Tax=Streptomyces ipomoeae TaxID=103232 RepID=UPI001146AE45|nr:hypothetical protein [Streptomyces ipomoeae]TQE33177.1 hypothetical protein Sipo7851_22050 [Streptomyces ipomoeae]
MYGFKETVEQATASVHTHLDAFYGEDYERLAEQLAGLVSAAKSGSQKAIDGAKAEIHMDWNAMYAPDYDYLAELLDAVVTVAKAEAAGADAAA